jgi:hypothetical protein
MRRTHSLSLVLVLLLASCGAFRAPVAPRSGALTQLDSDAYDGLLVSQAAISEAKRAYAAGELPPSAKGVINRAGEAYNVARASWLTYRDAVAAGKGDDEARGKLNADVLALTAAVADVFKLKKAGQP